MPSLKKFFYLSLVIISIILVSNLASKAYAQQYSKYFQTAACMANPCRDAVYFNDKCQETTGTLDKTRTGNQCCPRPIFEQGLGFEQCINTSTDHTNGITYSCDTQNTVAGFECYTPPATPTPIPPTPTPIPGIVTIQGRHIDQNGNNLSLSGQKVTVTPGNLSSSSQTWSFTNLPTGGYTVSASEIPGYEISWTKCINCTPSSNAAYTTGDLTTVTLSDNGDFANIYFKYTRVSCNSYSNCSSCILDLRCGWGVKDGNSFCTDWNSACRPQGYTGWYWQSCSTNENSCGAPAPTPLPTLKYT